MTMDPILRRALLAGGGGAGLGAAGGALQADEGDRMQRALAGGLAGGAIGGASGAFAGHSIQSALKALDALPTPYPHLSRNSDAFKNDMSEALHKGTPWMSALIGGGAGTYAGSLAGSKAEEPEQKTALYKLGANTALSDLGIL